MWTFHRMSRAAAVVVLAAGVSPRSGKKLSEPRRGGTTMTQTSYGFGKAGDPPFLTPQKICCEIEKTRCARRLTGPSG